MTKIYVVGIGTGSRDTLTKRGLTAIESSDCLIGAERMLESFSDFDAARFASVSYTEIAEYIRAHPQHQSVSVLASGDVGFFSIAKRLCGLLAEYEVELICGISSLVYFAAKLKTSWDDMKLVSLHGREGSIVGICASHPKVFLLTGGKQNAADICRQLCEHDMKEARVSIGENLSYPEERILTGTAGELTEGVYDSLCVMLVESGCPMNRQFVTHGIPDEAFIRGEVPMTKSEVRAVSLSKLQLGRDSVIYDIGAGTGSVAVEMALQSREGMVYAIEKNEKALDLIRENKEQFGAKNLCIIPGSAPEALTPLPSPDRAFIGGSSGNLDAIVDLLLSKNPQVRIVVNAIALESAYRAIEILESRGLAPEVVQISISKAKKAGPYHMMMGQNPVFIITGFRLEDNMPSEA